MERQSRLRNVERVLEIADAAFAVVQHLDDGQARLVGQGVEELRSSGSVSCGSHAV
jgi:hypothetical protein